jgi:HlyD family secretion protein
VQRRPGGDGRGLGLWVLFWPVPTEVMGQGVRKGQVLMELYLPVLNRQLQQQRGNLTQLEARPRQP